MAGDKNKGEATGEVKQKQLEILKRKNKI